MTTLSQNSREIICNRFKNFYTKKTIPDDFHNFLFSWYWKIIHNLYATANFFFLVYLFSFSFCRRTAGTSRYRIYQPSEIQVAFVTQSAAVVPGPPIMEILPHPKYHPVTHDNDIAVVKLSRKIKCGKFTRPICLPRPNMSVKHCKNFFTVGWGTVKGGRTGI